LDEISHTAIEEARAGIDLRPLHSADESPAAKTADPAESPEAILWAMLSTAPEEGTPVSLLISGTGMSRPWIYQRLRDLTDSGRANQVSRGRWRAVTEHSE
ncbi:hypothetical protein ACFQ07_31570, partial [Actinomadura adrarensis]